MNNNTNTRMESKATNQNRVDIERLISFIEPEELANVNLNENVILAIVKQSRHIILKKIILPDSAKKEISSASMNKEIINHIASQAGIKAPAMQVIEGTIQDGLSFSKSELLNFLKLLIAKCDTTQISALFYETMEARTAIAAKAEEKAAQCNQKFSPNYYVSCVSEVFAGQENQQFIAEIIQENPNNDLDCRFANFDDAFAFAEYLVKNNIISTAKEIDFDETYRENSQFVGKNVFSVRLGKIEYECLLAYKVNQGLSEVKKEAPVTPVAVITHSPNGSSNAVLQSTAVAETYPDSFFDDFNDLSDVQPLSNNTFELVEFKSTNNNTANQTNSSARILNQLWDDEEIQRAITLSLTQSTLVEEEKLTRPIVNNNNTSSTSISVPSVKDEEAPNNINKPK